MAKPGSYEARFRVRKAGRQPITIAELRKQHGLPDTAKFDGFIVWVRERDEFLVRVDDSPGVTQRLYGAEVMAAVRFASFDEAEPHAQASRHPAVVAVAFDVGGHIAVVG